MSVQPEHAGSGDIPELVAISDMNDSATWCSCTTESLLCSAGEIIVLRVEGEVDLCTLPILRQGWMTASPSTLPISSSMWLG